MSFLRPLLTPCRGGKTRTPCRGGRTRVSQKSSLFQHRLFTSYFKENFEYITLYYFTCSIEALGRALESSLVTRLPVTFGWLALWLTEWVRLPPREWLKVGVEAAK